MSPFFSLQCFTFFIIHNLFPGQDKAFVGWVNSEIKIPEGKMLHCEHQGYLSIFEKDLFLQFEKGLLTSQSSFPACSEHKQNNLKFIIKVIPSVRMNLILDRWNVL